MNLAQSLINNTWPHSRFTPDWEQVVATRGAVPLRLNERHPWTHDQRAAQSNSSQAVSARWSIGSQTGIQRSLSAPRQYSVAM